MKKTTLVRLAAVCGFSVLGTAFAAVTRYETLPTWMAAVPTSTMYGFEGAEGFPDPASGSFAPISMFPDGSILAQGDAGSANVYDGGGNQMLSGDSLFDRLTLKFQNTGVRAVAFDLIDLQAATGEFAVVRMGFTDGSPAYETIVEDDDADLNTSRFVGFTSTSDLSFVQVYAADTMPPTVGLRTVAMDNLRVETVPEPTTCAVLAVGVVGLLRKRMKK